MKTQTFLKGSFILFFSALITKALGALFKIPLTMLLGGVGMGYFGCAYGLFLPIYALSITGLSTAVASLVAKEHGAGQIQNVRKIRRTARLLFAGVGLLLSGFIWLFCSAVCPFHGCGCFRSLCHSDDGTSRLFWLSGSCGTGLL